MKTLRVEEYTENTDRYQLIDVRSPGEYEEAHIPGAVNVPLFTDEERAQVGTVYRHEGTDQAKQVGLELVSQRLPEIMQQILAAADGKEIVLYCWRGGMRSRSMCSFMDALQFPVWQLVGGYKAFRRYINNFHHDRTISVPVFVLNGLTGVGKTLLLARLKSRGLPTIDLESMANHRGSAFGSVGLGPARSQKDFEALLAYALMEYKNAPCLIVEGEGKRIRAVHVPDYFFFAMNEGPHILLEADLEVRVERIVAEYQSIDTSDELAAAVCSLQKKLGKVKCEELEGQIREGKYHQVVMELCRDYYDLYYRDSQKNTDNYLACVNVNDLEFGTEAVISVIKEYLKNKKGAVS